MRTAAPGTPRLWPVLIATAVGLAILVSLGTWQLQRLQWKEALLAKLAANAAAAPVTLSDVTALAATGGDPELVRVHLRVTYLHDQAKLMMATFEGGPGWTIITPAVTADGEAVLVDRGRVPVDAKDKFDRPSGENDITGVIRTHNRRGPFEPDNDPAKDLWYTWDIPALVAATTFPAEAKPYPYVVQLLGAEGQPLLPRPEEPRANLANNHLGYAITWFGLALTLLGVSAAYLRGLRKAAKPSGD